MRTITDFDEFLDDDEIDNSYLKDSKDSKRNDNVAKKIINKQRKQARKQFSKKYH